MTETVHHVCDRCGHYWQRAATACPACKSVKLWEFPAEQPAREHAARVKSVPLFRVTP